MYRQLLVLFGLFVLLAPRPVAQAAVRVIVHRGPIHFQGNQIQVPLTLEPCCGFDTRGVVLTVNRTAVNADTAANPGQLVQALKSLIITRIQNEFPNLNLAPNEILVEGGLQ
jgi:hypothetical protein